VISTRRIPWLESWWHSTASSSTGCQKLGHPLPESYFVFELNKSAPQQTQRYTPDSLQSWYLPVKARSVPFWRVIRNCSGVSSRCHSSSLFSILSLGILASLAPPPALVRAGVPLVPTTPSFQRHLT